MSTPICPIHNSPMKPSQKGGGFFCARKNPDGSWCSYKPTAAPAEAATGTQGASRGLVALSLDFASRVYQGTADPAGALELANAVFIRWEEPS